MLNATVHHEMLAPLKVTKEISVYLKTKLTDKKDKKLAEAIKTSSRMLQLHIQDLLDNNVIQKDGFKPAYEVGSLSDAIDEIGLMM